MAQIQFTEDQLCQILRELDRFGNEVIEPLSETEVLKIESAYLANPPTISPERDARQRAFIEELRQEWIKGREC